MQNERELSALIQLLDDEDQEVYSHVQSKLLSFGAEVIPTLETAWGTEINPLQHQRLENIIHQIHFKSLQEDFATWAAEERPDLLTGAYLVAKYHYPDLQLNTIREKLQRIRQAIWLELDNNQTPLEQLQIFNQVFYQHQRFKGTQISFEYRDYCINHVVDTHSGSSIGVGIAYQLLANDLALPVYGVPLPKYFVLSFCKSALLDFDNTDHALEREVMFYVNPINRGAMFSRNEIKDYLQKMELSSQSRFYSPADNKSIVATLLGEMAELYESQGNSEHEGDMLTMLEVLNA